MVLYVPGGIDWSEPAKDVLVKLVRAFCAGNLHPAPPGVLTQQSQASNTIKHCMLQHHESHDALHSPVQHHDSTMDTSGAHSMLLKEDASVSSDDSLGLSHSGSNTSQVLMVDLDSPPPADALGSSNDEVVVLQHNLPPVVTAPVPRASTPVANAEVVVSRPKPPLMDTMPLPSSIDREAVARAALQPEPPAGGMFPDLMASIAPLTLRPIAAPLASSTTKYQYGSEDIRFPRGAAALPPAPVSLTLEESDSTGTDTLQNQSSASSTMDQDTSMTDLAPPDAQIAAVAGAAPELEPNAGEDEAPVTQEQGQFWEHPSDSPTNATLHMLWFKHRGRNRMTYNGQDGSVTITEFCAYCDDHRELNLSRDFKVQIERWMPLIQYVRQQIVDMHVNCVNPYCGTDGTLRVLSDTNVLSLNSAWDIWRVFCLHKHEALENLFAALRSQNIKGPDRDVFNLYRDFEQYYQDYEEIPPGHAPQVLSIPSYDRVGSVPVSFNANITDTTRASQFECKVCYQSCPTLWVVYNDCG